jgi:hypothetical protein
MYIAGVADHDEQVLELARLLHDAGFDDTRRARGWRENVVASC